MDLAGRISQTNGRLKAASVGVRVEQKGDRLYLRATFPPRPGSRKTEPYQQRLALGFHATPQGLSQAEKEARKIGGLLDLNQFSWDQYRRTERPERGTCEEWIEKHKVQYLEKGGKPETWQGDYWKAFKHLPQHQALTVELLEALIDRTSENSKSRKRFCTAAGALAKLAGLAFDPAPLAGNYGPGEVEPREIPSDELIAKCWYELKNPAWRWFYGMLAAYGLRPHEVFRIDFAQLGKGERIVQVLDQTKTGRHRVWPFYPEWFDEFDLANVQVPPIDVSRGNEFIGRSACSRFWGKIPFNLYSLRHAWSIRTLEFGLPTELAAQQQGHSHSTHVRIYHRWITDRTHQRAIDLIMRNPDRPLPPTGIGLPERSNGRLA